ncbi:hypothetical protein N7481_006796 [Penicillium waksmanii]|uniref:uncharacterized protein n=1 Tax=Penicillium waksmanii TaxID=69791 RepID=UPI0025475EA1|nr:uncharacterized protein N7481_006796 [Penicillium waksmanii]KAJ5984697.1 hypothetical protein N7481_006796 [Penicillium waksmanii]
MALFSPNEVPASIGADQRPSATGYAKGRKKWKWWSNKREEENEAIQRQKGDVAISLPEAVGESQHFGYETRYVVDI